MRLVLVLAAGLVLAACQPVTRPGGPPIGVGPDARDAVRACTAEARWEGYEVRRVVFERPVRGGGGRLIGFEVIMRVAGRRGPREIRCDYDLRTGDVALFGGGVRPPAGPDLPRAERACIDRARDRGLAVRRILSRRVSGAGYNAEAVIVMRVARRGEVADLRCEHRFADGRTRLERIGDGGIGGGGVRPPDIGLAERFCRQRARDRGFEVRRVLTRRILGSGRNARAELRMRITAQRGRVTDVRCDYNFRTGRVALVEIGGGRPPPPGAGGGDFTSADRREAVRACRREASRRGLAVLSVLSARATRYSAGAPLAAQVRMRTRKGGRELTVRCDYSFRTGGTTMREI